VILGFAMGPKVIVPVVVLKLFPKKKSDRHIRFIHYGVRLYIVAVEWHWQVNPHNRACPPRER